MSPQDFPKLLHTLLECGKNGATEREALTFWHVCARTNTGKGCHAYWDGVSTWHNQKCQQKVDEESAGPLMCMCCCYLLLVGVWKEMKNRHTDYNSLLNSWNCHTFHIRFAVGNPLADILWHLEPLQCYLPDFWGAQKLDDNSDACGSAMKTCFGRVPLCTQMHVKARVKCRQLLDTDTSPVIPSRRQSGFARVNQHNQTNQCKSQCWKKTLEKASRRPHFWHSFIHSNLTSLMLDCCLTRIEP